MTFSSKESPSNSDVDIKLYGYRWVIIVVYALFNSINYYQCGQFCIIADVVQDYYQVDSFLVKLTGLVFMIAFILFFIPVGYIVENTNLRTSSLISAGLTAVGNCLKLLATSPDSFYWVLISQTLCAIAQVFMLITPSKVACVWFGAEEVSKACAIGLFGSQMGVALGALVPVLMVKSNDNKDVVRDGLNSMFIYNAAVSVAFFVLVILFFRAKPPTPPSYSQANLSSNNEDNKITYWAATKEFAKNRDYLIVLCTMGISYGMWNCFGIMVNQMYNEAFPDDDGSDLGIMAFAANIAGGCFGTMIFGSILDKTHKFKLVTFVVLLLTTITSIGQSVCFLNSSKVGSFIFFPAYGFFGGSLMVICFEYAIETTYPIPEAFGAAILNTVIYIFAIIYVIVLSIVFDTVGYTVGYTILVVSIALSALGILFISPELRRRNANIKAYTNEGFTQH